MRIFPENKVNYSKSPSFEKRENNRIIDTIRKIFFRNISNWSKIILYQTTYLLIYLSEASLFPGVVQWGELTKTATISSFKHSLFTCSNAWPLLTHLSHKHALFCSILPPSNWSHLQLCSLTLCCI